MWNKYLKFSYEFAKGKSTVKFNFWFNGPKHFYCSGN